MKLKSVIIVLIGIFYITFFVRGSYEFQITSNESGQGAPEIYGNIVVWTDDRNGNLDIYGYNLSTKEEFQITTDPYDQESPAIYGDIVVWEDYRNVYADIYGYNLKTKEEFQITTDEDNQMGPAIYGDIVVWMGMDSESYNLDIYGYNLKTKEEFRITTDPDFQRFPAIYENVVVWVDFRSGKGDIYGIILPSPVSQTEETEKPPETVKSQEEGKGGICSGTLFILLILGMSAHSKRNQ